MQDNIPVKNINNRIPKGRSEYQVCVNVLIKGTQQLISCVGVLNGSKWRVMDNFSELFVISALLILGKKHHSDFNTNVYKQCHMS